MNWMTRSAASVLGLCLCVSLARAAEAADGAAASADPRLSLQAGAASEVMQDTVRIALAAEIQAKDQASAGKQLSAALDDIVKQAAGTAGVEVSTGGYSVWPQNNDQGKIAQWRGRGEVLLESRDFAAAAALAARLGDKAAISNIAFMLSRQAREAEERKLLDQAAQAFRERSQAAAKAFGFSGYRLISLELGGSGEIMPRVPVMAMAKAAGGAVAAPLEAGKVTVNVSVNGTIALH